LSITADAVKSAVSVILRKKLLRRFRDETPVFFFSFNKTKTSLRKQIVCAAGSNMPVATAGCGKQCV
jgi:hypothetical protein